MPSLGADMEDGTLVEWTVTEGDTVARGDVIAVIETQKGAIEIECFEAGVISKLLVELGQIVPVGEPLAIIGEDAVSAAEPAAAQPPAPAPTPAPPPITTPTKAVEPAPVTPASAPEPASAHASIAVPADGLRASPAARSRARDLGIDLAGIRGTGPDHVIVLSDVERTQPASDVQESLPSPKVKDSKAEMRKAIAAAMARSKQTIPHFYLSQAIDIRPALDHLAALNADRPPRDRLLLSALLVRATALSARDCPTLNGHYSGEAFTPSAQVNVGVAIALRGGGLVAPALMQADALTLDATMAAMRDLVSRARTGRLRGTEMTAGTITLSSLGDSGAEAMAGVIFPPQVTLVGIGAPNVRPWVIDGSVQPRSVIQLTLSVDHRANDGRQASRFIAALETHLQTPEEL